MTAAELLRRAREKGIRLSARGEVLHYEAPRGALEPALRDELKQHKRELLSLLARETETQAYPLSPAQTSFWLLERLNPGSRAALEQFRLQLRGALDEQRLAEAWLELQRRYPVLRIRVSDAESPRQYPGPAVALNCRDIEAGSAAEFAHSLRALAESELSVGIDLGRDAPLRALLVRARTAGEAVEPVLLVTAHHIAADGLTVRLLQTELAAIYAALAQHTPLPALAPDYLVHYTAAPLESACDESVAYWRRQLDGMPQALDLPRLPGSRPDARQQRLPLVIPADLADRLRALASAEQATLFAVLTALLRLLISRLAGQRDFGIGTAVTGRVDAEALRTPGCFVNNIVLRNPVAPDGSFLDLLRGERDAVLAGLGRSQLPFQELVARLNPARQPGVHPLFQLLFLFEPPHDEPPRAGGLEFRLETFSELRRESFWDLELSLTDHGAGREISGYLGYAEALFDAGFASALPARLTALAARLVARPEAPVSGHSLLLCGELEALHALGAGETRDWPPPHSLHALVLAQCEATPDRVALIDGEQRWTYARLRERVLELASALADAGIGPGDRVALALAPSADSVAALLAVSCRGAVYLPLDPAYPAQRLQFMLEDAGARLLITERQPDWSTASGLPVLELARLDGCPAAKHPVLDVSADTPVALLYTSGSTGSPKGAYTLHRGVVNRCRWMWQAYGVGPDEVFCLRTSFNFIDSLWEIAGSLGRGARLLVLRSAAVRDPAALLGALRDGRVTQLVLVPTVLRGLLDQPNALVQALSGLRCCITSGEPCPPELLARWRRALPGVRLVNTYGTSEVWDATHCEISNLETGSTRVPIGEPLDNTQVWLLDEAGQPVPRGVVGEICVAGHGLGGGYHRRPELTVQRFPAHPWRDGARMYRTGDLGRWRADGLLECLGRVDQQVKLRGLRIELGEIETALAALPGVTAAAARVCDPDSAAPRLLAWTVGDCQQPEALRDSLRERLPDALVPARIVPVDRLPLTPSGKLDRLRLEEPAAVECIGSRAPLTGIQREVADVWQGLLQRPIDDADADFFAEGGHSLMAAQLIARLNRRCNARLKLTDLFAGPSVAGLAQAIERRRGESGAVASEPAAGGDRAPLSFGQERLWFFEQLDPGSAAYHIAFEIIIAGGLSEEWLAQAIEDLQRRHPALRTVFPARGGVPEQQVLQSLPLRPETLDGHGLEDRKRFARRPFDIERGPLFRVAICREEAGARLLLVIHHLVTDGRSNAVIFRDLAALYAARATGLSPRLPAPDGSYLSFSRVQRRAMADGEYGPVLDWWRTQLADAPAALALPADRPRPPEQRYRGAWLRRQLTRDQLSALEKTGSQLGASLYMVLLSAWYLLLRRYSGQSDILIGSPVQGRPGIEFENNVGLFINTLLLRINITETCGFSEAVQQVRRIVLEAQAHQQLPFEKLVEALQPERSLSRSPLFQSLFNLTEMPALELPAAGTRWRLGELLDHEVANFDLSLNIGRHAEGAELLFEYDRDLFDEASIADMAEVYLALLDSVGGTLRWVTDKARHRLLARNPEPRPETAFTAVHLQVAEQVRRNPRATALVGPDGAAHSYAAMHARAASIVVGLRRAGVGRGDLVALLLAPGPELVSALLAVLRCGAAYLPLDPDSPKPRVDAMLEDACPALVIASDFVSTWAATGWFTPEQLAASSADEEPPYTPTADDPAYALFTSGSTGRPKAVLVGHAALAAAAESWQAEYGLRATDRHMQAANPAFDVFTADWIRALTTGGCLVFCPRDELLEPAALAQRLAIGHITVAEFTPAVLRGLLAHWREQPPNLPALRLLAAGGETWYAHEYRELRQLLGPETRLVNSYGVAEATVDSSYYEHPRGPAGDRPLPIGRPFPHARIYICDAAGDLQPPGVPGELCIGGAGVALGYLHRPELTGERFVPDPYSEVDGARLYRTGDRARWRSDGELELLGRLDRQVKLRGFRIELGEIEAALLAQPGVDAAAVELMTTAVDGDARLVAWVVGTGDEAGLRAGLAEQLPGYMLPAAWVWLQALPLTPNGKLDRSALPAPAWRRDAAGSRTPATPLAGLVAEVMGSVLGVSGVGPTEDFFARGGHSLLATRLVARLRELLGVELPLRAVFEAPTPEGLARKASSAGEAESAPRALPRDRSSWPVSPAQRRLWFLAELAPDTSAWHLHWSVRLHGELDRGALQSAVAALLARHESLRTGLVARDGEPEQVIASTLATPLFFAEPEPGELDARLQAFVQQPFDLAEPPLWRVGVFGDGADQQVLALVIHHIVADGWSLSILFRELGELYRGARRGEPAQLPALALQYADYAAWQQQRLAGGELERQLAYWRAHLAGVPDALPLPTDRPRLALPAGRGAWRSARFQTPALDDLKAVFKENKVTYFIGLLAVFKALLSRWTGAEDLVVATPAAGRGHLALEDQVGFFINTLPLRGDLSGNPDLSELLGRQRRVCLNAFVHAEYPFEKLVEALAPRRDPARHPVAQVACVLHNQPGATLALDGLDASPLLMENDAAKYDLNLHFAEDDDGLQLSLNYDPALFDAVTMDWLLSGYVGVLRQWSRDPALRLGDLDLGDPGSPRGSVERRSVLPGLRGFAGAVDVGQAFLAQLGVREKSLAVDDGVRRWSYGALAAVAGRVAESLAGIGVAGDRVGLVAQPNAVGIAGLMGILLAGRAYVPLDPSQPLARLRRLSAGCLAVVSDASLCELAGALCDEVRLIDTDTGDSRPVTAIPVPADTPAYVLHTSGTTGAPKAVTQTRAGLLRQVARYVAGVGICADDRLSLLSSLGFDAAVQDVFGALLSGASLHPVDLRRAGSGAEVADALVSAGVTVFHATPTVYRYVFGDELSCRHELAGIRAVVLGGEVARRSDWALFCTRFARGTKLVNGYGLTESTVVSQWQGDHDSRIAGDVLPLGWPLEGIEVQLLDESGEASWRGEIVLRGAGLAEADESGVYRTGDIGRWQADGQLAWVGRKDAQLKLNGVRVEPGEVEAVLCRGPGVTGCAVVGRERDGEVQLVAYVTGLADADALAALRDWARDELAPWQWPGAWQRLASLPTRPNGKLDASRLPEPGPVAGTRPVGELETALAGLWAELLGVEAVQREDDFFALGGHSLMATRLIARIRGELGRDLALREVFAHPRLEALAAVLATSAPLTAGPALERQPRAGGRAGRAAQRLTH